MRSRGDPKRITRPFLKEEQCESQFGVDDPVMFVIATGWREDGEHWRYVKGPTCQELLRTMRTKGPN